MSHHLLYPMDTNFGHGLGRYPISTQLEMAKSLGYTGSYLTLFGEREHGWIDAWHRASEANGLELAGIYITARLDESNDATYASLHKLMETLKPGTTLELALGSWDSGPPPSSAIGHPRAVALLKRILPLAESNDLTISLYPHVDIWLERHDEALKLCQQINHPRLKMNFCGFHWFAIHDHQDLVRVLNDAAPFLQNVNLCGVRRGGDVGGHTILPLGEGQMDNFVVLSLLDQIGFTGPIGFQGYSIGGDPYTSIKRSLAAYQEMRARLTQHPTWGQVVWDD